LLIAAATCAAIWLWRFVPQLRLLYYQHQCLNYSPTSMDVAFDAKRGAVQPPACWIAMGFNPRSTCVFLHARRAKGCDTRLVQVAMFSNTGQWGIARLLDARAFILVTSEPHSRLSIAQLQSSERLSLPVVPNTEPDTLRLFAGQADPADESHFTIRYELNGQPGLIDGWLMPDDTVKLEPREGPLRR
jgi:hypothetical protein